MGEGRTVLDHSLHGISELLERDHAIVVLVHLVHDLIPYLSGALRHMPAPERSNQLLLADVAILIHINHLEGATKILRGQKDVLFESGRDKLSIVDNAIFVDIRGRKHGPYIRRIQVEYITDVLKTLFEFGLAHVTIVIFVQLDEHLPHLNQILRLRLQVGNDRAHTRLESGRFAEGRDIRSDVKPTVRGKTALWLIRIEPWVLEEFIEAGPLASIFLEASFDEIFGFGACIGELLEVGLLVDDRVVDLLLVLAWEGCIACQ